jgi:hypothetical protein
MAAAVNTVAAAGAVASLALAANPARVSALFVNSGAVPVYLGQAGVMPSNGIPIQLGQSFVDEASDSAWYAVTSGGTGQLTICEVS